jgi:hypothetical protein
MIGTTGVPHAFDVLEIPGLIPVVCVVEDMMDSLFSG